MKRSHTCGALTIDAVNQGVLLNGWVQSIRDHGGLLFCDLRDRYGLTQVVFDPAISKEMFQKAESLRREFVIEIQGNVRARPDDMVNKNMATGTVEVVAHSLTILNKSETPPLEIDDRKVASDDLRLRYRYLDLRRPTMQKQFLIRHHASQAARRFLNSKNFLEIETPLLIKSTPEGARDYVVPSRVNPGQFYALPQSPQIYKEILMVSGFDRYYQFARCLRDEDLRADRQPEFTQIDLEMSFVQPEDIYAVIEGMITSMFKDALHQDLQTPFPRMTHKEALDKYGIDKPDTRFGMLLHNVGQIVKDADFQVFAQVLSKNGIIKAINAKGCAEKYSRKQIEGRLLDHAKEHGAQGLAWMKMEEGKLQSSIVKFFSKDIQQNIIKEMDAQDGDLILFVADNSAVVNNALAHLRIKIAQDHDMIPKNTFHFLWITDFPLFEWDDDAGRWSPSHHIFTRPKEAHINDLEDNPGKVLSDAYDCVLNGIELGSGSIRINEPALQQRTLNVIGMSAEEAAVKFGFLMESFRYGAPPHGGIAIGLDRLTALMCGFNDIREVMAFPKNKKAQCPMDGSPAPISETVMKELHIKSDVPQQKKQ